jgi:hypothetical protein
MKLKTAILGSISALTLIAAAASANAGTTFWSLSGVTFDDGATATGTFAYDTVTGLVTAAHITTTGGVLTGYTYDSTDSDVGNNFFQINSFYAVEIPDLTRDIELAFAAPLSAGGVDNLLVGNTSDLSAPGSYECNDCIIVRQIVSGKAVESRDHVITDGPGVPEPATWAMMITGFGLAGAALRRRGLVAA